MFLDAGCNICRMARAAPLPIAPAFVGLSWGVPSTETHKPPQMFSLDFAAARGRQSTWKGAKSNSSCPGKGEEGLQTSAQPAEEKSGASIWRQHQALVPQGWHRPKGRHAMASPETRTVQGRCTDPAAALSQILNTRQSPQHCKSAPC